MQPSRILGLAGVCVSLSAAAAFAVTSPLLVAAGGSPAAVTGAHALAMSSDGAHLFVAQNSAGTVTELDLDGTGAITGAVTPSNPQQCGNNALKQATGIALTPRTVGGDAGYDLYLSSRFNNSVVALHYDAVSPGFSCLGTISDKTNLRRATSVSVSPDGKTVYVTATSAKQERVSAYSRNTSSGLLSFLASYRDNTVGGGNSLSGPTASLVSGDEGNVYVTAAGDSAITRFLRATLVNIGTLSSPAALVNGQGGVSGLAGAGGLAISADGKNVYTAGTSGNAIGVFERGGSGTLTFNSVVNNNVGPVTGLGGITGLAVSPTGAYVFGAAATSGALTVFGRNPLDGSLTFVDSVANANLAGARAVVVSPNGQCVYVAAETASVVDGYCFPAAGFDFGDAPNDGASWFYPTTKAEGGAQAVIGDVYLGGTAPTPKSDGTDSDLNAATDPDDNGVTFTSPIGPAPATDTVTVTWGTTDTVNITSTRLDAWIDFNGDGDWNDPGEQIFSNQLLVDNGAVPNGACGSAAVPPQSPRVCLLTFQPTVLLINGTSYARFRVHELGMPGLPPGGGQGVGEVEDYKVTLVSTAVTVHVAKTGTGTGTVVSNDGPPPSINCGSTCTAPYAGGGTTSIQLTATADVSSTFAGWTGCDSVSGTNSEICHLDNMTTDKNPSAAFTIKTFGVLVTVSEAPTSDGTSTVSDTGPSTIVTNCTVAGGGACTASNVTYGTQVVLTPSPGANYTFTGWGGLAPASCQTSLSPCSFTVTSDFSTGSGITASFAKSVFELVVDPTVGTGSGLVQDSGLNIDCSSDGTHNKCFAFYTTGTPVTLTATAAADSVFVGPAPGGWGGDCAGTGSCNVTMSADHNVTAFFTLGTDASVTVADSIFPSTYANGATVTVTVTLTASPSQADIVNGNLTTSELPAANLTGVTWTCAPDPGNTGGSTCASSSGSGNINQAINLVAGDELVYTLTGTALGGANGGVDTFATVTSLNDINAANNSGVGISRFANMSFAEGFENDGTPTQFLNWNGGHS